MPLSIRRVALATLLALVMLMAWGLSNTSHQDAANASWLTCGHATQSIHELSNPPSSWPGTRAAHTVWLDGAGNRNQNVYTKSGWWDPTWDFYYTSFKLC